MKKKVYLEMIRILAICLVVFNHSDGYFLHFSVTDHPATYVVSLFFSVLCRINVPLFFMVSGALLLEKEESIRELYKKRVGRMISVLFLFSFVQYFADIFWRNKEGNYGIADFFQRVYTGNIMETYWFLYAYLSVLLMLPFLRKMAKGMKVEEYHYLFLLKVLFDCLLRLVGILTKVNTPLEIFVITDSVFYVLMGYYMEYVLSEKAYYPGNGKRVFLLGIGAILASMAAVIGEYKVGGVYTQNCLGLFNPILTISVYYMVKLFCNNHMLPVKLERLVIWIGSTAFGIYLVEKLIRRQLLPVYLYLCEETVGVFANAVYVVLTVLFGVVYVSLLKCIPGIRRLL